MSENKVRKTSRENFYSENPYRKHFDPVQKVAAEVSQALKQLLKLNTDFEWEGDYTSGQKLNVRKAIEVIMRNEAGIFTEDDFKLFLKKRFPTHRSHKVVIALDESGSMKGEAQTPAMQAMMLFQYVMDQLGIEYSVVGFSDYAQIHKQFDEPVKSTTEKNDLADILETSGGGMTNDLEGVKTADTLLGEGKKLVIGVGIGAGTEAVRDVYKNHYQADDFKDLPKVLVGVLTRVLLSADSPEGIVIVVTDGAGVATTRDFVKQIEE